MVTYHSTLGRTPARNVLPHSGILPDGAAGTRSGVLRGCCSEYIPPRNNPIHHGTKYIYRWPWSLAHLYRITTWKILKGTPLLARLRDWKGEPYHHEKRWLRLIWWRSLGTKQSDSFQSLQQWQSIGTASRKYKGYRRHYNK